MTHFKWNFYFHPTQMCARGNSKIGHQPFFGVLKIRGKMISILLMAISQHVNKQKTLQVEAQKENQENKERK